MPAPAVVDKALFTAAQEQLRENRVSLGDAKARSSSTRSDVLCPLWIRILRQNRSSKGERKCSEGFSLLSVPAMFFEHIIHRPGGFPEVRRIRGCANIPLWQKANVSWFRCAAPVARRLFRSIPS